MTATKLRPAPSPHTDHQDGSAGRTVVHAENPDQPGHALCGQAIGRNASAAATRCVVCADLIRPTFWTR